MAAAARWLEGLRYLSETVAVVDRFRHWGYTIYRTGYGPSSDLQWAKLLQKIQAQAYEKTLKLTGAAENDPNLRQIWSLFCLDARSDPALDGLDIEQLRLLYRNGDGSALISAGLRSHRVFLVADDEILSEADASAVKCVEADYEAANHVGNKRVPQRYFGWMPMRAGCVVELWKHLENRELESIAPQTIGGSHLEIWEDEQY
ncbi:hypothetical protein FB567DRAFT_578359 [Paraphoma chrysanthemicola]|uniref:Uncharacterized protein n=1 Tax=Paraphoma chrysanthemicola TaxID=798071 RepID=A0A8K0R9I6_9PLEO|nr:hypothetical protein FB567DRAFT_578359 [Paraphoma chrysanthemicola]